MITSPATAGGVLALERYSMDKYLYVWNGTEYLSQRIYATDMPLPARDASITLNKTNYTIVKIIFNFDLDRIEIYVTPQ